MRTVEAKAKLHMEYGVKTYVAWILAQTNTIMGAAVRINTDTVIARRVLTGYTTDLRSCNSSVNI